MAEEDVRWDRPTTFSDNTHENKRKIFYIVAIVALVIGLGLIIAGSIMLGVGVSKSKKHCDPVNAVPKYLTVLTNVSYVNAVKDYNSVAKSIQQELTSTLSNKNSGAPVVTILGLSIASDGKRTNAFVGVTYTSQNEMSDQDMMSNISKSKDLQLNILEDTKVSNAVQRPMCLAVNPYNDIAKTTQSPSNTTFTSTTTTSPTTTVTTPVPVQTTTQCACTSPTPIATTATTTTVKPINPALKDVFLLIDDSVAVGTVANYQSIVNWLMNDLVKSWNVGADGWEVSPVLYANTEYRALKDFDESNVNDLIESLNNSVSRFEGKQLSNIESALKIATVFPSRPGVPRTYILISAGSDTGDIMNAKKYTKLIADQGGELITLTVGNANSTILGTLATQSAFSFNSSSTFSPSENIADQMNQVLVEDTTTTSTTTTTTVSTTTPILTTKPSTPKTPHSSAITTQSVPHSSAITTQSVPHSSAITTQSVPHSSAITTQSVPHSSAITTQSVPHSSAITTQSVPHSSAITTKSVPHSSTITTKTVPHSSTITTKTVPHSSTITTKTVPHSSTITTKTVPHSSTITTKTVPHSSTITTKTVPHSSTITTKTVPHSSTITTKTVPHSSTITTKTVPHSSTIVNTQSTSPAPTGTTTAQSTKTPISCGKDLLILVDQSNAYKSFSNFNQVKHWLAHKLVPRFVFDNNDMLASVYEFSNTTFNDVGADYAEQDTDELIKLIDNTLLYSEDSAPGLSRALSKADSLDAPRGIPTVLLISASDEANDVTAAIPFANQLKNQGGAFITLAVGSSLSGHLGKLSSGFKYTFVSTEYSISDDKTDGIVEAICSDLSTTTNSPLPTTTELKTTMSAPTDFSCNPDVAILIDSSSQAQSENDFKKTVSFIADTLVINWDISPAETEGLGMVGSGDADPILTENAYNLNSANDFSDAILELGNNYLGGDTSLTKLLKSLKNTIPHKRATAPLTAIIFTHYTDVDDISEAKKVIDGMNVNLIAVGIGKSANSKLLYKLTGNVVSAKLLNGSLKQSIQKLICSSNPATNPPATTPQTTVTTTAQPKTTVLSTVSTIATTQPNPVCADCYPDVSDILILMDCSNAQKADAFENQKNAVIQLTSNWNHMKRVSAACYSTKLNQFAPYSSLNSNNDLALLINAQSLQDFAPDLSKSLHQAVGITSTTGNTIQHTILFITKNDGPAILRAVDPSQELIKKGSVTSIAAGFDDLNNLSILSSPNSAIAWKDTSDINSVVQAIMNTIPHANKPPTPGSTLPSSSTTAQPKTTTALPKTTVAAKTTTVQPKTTVAAKTTTVQPKTTVAAKTTTVQPKTTVAAKTTTVQPKTTVTAKTTTAQPKTTVLSTVSTIATTQPNPVCADCYPDVSDILILMDCSNAQEADAFENQKNAVIQLTSNWNHMERVSAACYSSALDQFAPYSSLNSNNDLALLIKVQNLQKSAPDLSKSLHQAVGITSTTGNTIQHTILFITKNDGPAILRAVDPSQELIKKGSVTSIAAGFDDLNNLSILSSPNSAIAWKDTSDINSVVQAIMNTIPHANKPPTPGSTLPSSSTTAQPKTTTALPKTTVAAKTTTVQPKTTVAAKTTTVQPKTTVAAKTSTVQPKTTVAAKTTTVQPKTTVTAKTTTAQPKTTVATTIDPNFFNPPKANLMIVLDASANQDSKNFAQQKKAAEKLVSNWNHIQRTTLGSFADQFLETAGYTDMSTTEELLEYIGLQDQSSGTSDIKNSMEGMNTVLPLPTFGKQTTILFVSVQDPTGLQSSYQAAESLSAKGGLIMIAVGTDDVHFLNELCSNKQAIPWKNLDDVDSVVQSISQQIGEEYAQSTTAKTTVASTTGGSTTVKTTPASTTGGSTTVKTTPASTTGGSTTVKTTPASTTGGSTTVKTTPASTTGGSTTVKTTPASTTGGSTTVKTTVASTTGGSTTVKTTVASTTGGSTTVKTTNAHTTQSTTAKTTSLPKEKTTIVTDIVVPEMSSILLIMDCSNAQTDDQHNQQIEFVMKLIQSWTNFERVYITCFGDGLLNDEHSYGTIVSKLDAEDIIAQEPRTHDSPNIERVFKEASLIDNDPQYGVQHTILISYSRGTDEAQGFAGDLMAKGTTTIVGVALEDTSSLVPLASLHRTFSWDGKTVDNALIQKIIDSLHQ